MGAIRILQERPIKSQVKVEYAQTVQTKTPTPPPSEHPPISLPSTSESDPLIIKPDTHVYAIWLDDDGLVYEVC